MWIETEEEARFVEEERLKSKEEEKYLQRKDEEEARLAEGARLKVEEHERARLKLEEGVCLALESRWRVEEEQEHHSWMKAEERASIFEEEG